MLVKRFRIVVGLALVSGIVVQLACMPGDSSDTGVAKAIGNEETPPASVGGPESGSSGEVPVEALSSLEKVYVPLKAASMMSLDEALAEKGYGNVMASDFEPKFEHAEAEFGNAVVAYSSGDWVPSESLFQQMSVTQWLDAALADDAAEGAIINPGHPGQTLALTKTEIVEAMGWLPRQPPLPMEIYIAQ